MDIVERLRSVGGIEGTTRYYVNPDGPEAAAEIARLREALRQICRVKDELGRPWHTYDEAMMIAESALQQKDSE